MVEIVLFEAWHLDLIENPRNDREVLRFGVDMERMRKVEDLQSSLSVFHGNKLLGCGGVAVEEGVPWFWVMADEEAGQHPVLFHRMVKAFLKVSPPAVQALVSAKDARAMKYAKRMGFRGRNMVFVHAEVPRYIRYVRE